MFPHTRKFPHFRERWWKRVRFTILFTVIIGQSTETSDHTTQYGNLSRKFELLFEKIWISVVDCMDRTNRPKSYYVPTNMCIHLVPVSQSPSNSFNSALKLMSNHDAQSLALILITLNRSMTTGKSNTRMSSPCNWRRWAGCNIAVKFTKLPHQYRGVYRKIKLYVFTKTFTNDLVCETIAEQLGDFYSIVAGIVSRGSFFFIAVQASSTEDETRNCPWKTVTRHRYIEMIDRSSDPQHGCAN